jgi:hypothetical protein
VAAEGSLISGMIENVLGNRPLISKRRKSLTIFNNFFLISLIILRFVLIMKKKADQIGNDKPSQIGEEEDDFMSDTFLNALVSGTSTAMPETYSQKRQREQRQAEERNRQNQIKPRRQLEQEQRDRGLQQALDASNKGFQLFHKIAQKSNSGMADATQGKLIPIHLKLDRRGLGHATTTQNEHKDKHKEETVSDDMDEVLAYRSRQQQRLREKQIHGDLVKSRLACEQLDKRKGISRHTLWIPEVAVKTEVEPGSMKTVLEEQVESEDTDEEEYDDGEQIEVVFEDQEDPEKLIALTSYLRSIHFYCHWCGIEYENADELAASCPGSTREDHDEI